MKINKMTDYAIRAIRVMEWEEGVVTSKMISERECIPQGVLMKVLRKLRQAGLIQSHQGRGELIGGFSMVKKTEEISLLDIIEVMEGEICLNTYTEDCSYCSKDKRCTIHEEFFQINESLKYEMSRQPLKNLLQVRA